MSRRFLQTYFPLLLVLVTLIAYLPMTRATFIWDDDDYLTANTIYDTPTALHDIWFQPSYSPQYYPVVFTMFYIEHAIYGGFNALGYHLVNVLLHAANAILLWLVLRRLKVPGAMLAAAVFALHPLMAESVSWVTERKNTLSLLFFLSSLLAYLRFGFQHRIRRESGGLMSLGIPGGDWGFYALSLLFYVLALLSKSVTCGLAPVLVLLIWWKRPRGSMLQYLLTIPYFVFGLAAGLYTAHLEVTHVGAFGADWKLTGVQRILLASRDLCFYVYKLLLPVHLSLYYDRWTIDPRVWWQWLFPVVVLGVLAALALSIRRIGRGPLAAAIAFIALVFPALGFFSIYPFVFSWVADHFVYHASTVFIAAISAVLTLAARRFFPGRADLRLLAAIPLLAVLGILTTLTSANFASPETLWASVINYNPEHPNFNALAGMSSVLSAQAEAARRTGNLAEAQRLMDEAHAYDQRSLEERPDNPVIYHNFAAYYLFNNKPELALEPALKSVDLSKNDPRMWARLSQVYHELHQLDKAIDAARMAVNLQKRRVAYHITMARLLLEKGDEDRARQYIANVLQYLAPRNSDAHLLLGTIYVRHDKLLDAIAEFRQAVEVNPENLEAQDALARAIALNPMTTPTDFQQAMESIGVALKATNGMNSAYLDTLGLLLARAGQYKDAYGIWQDALQKAQPSDTATIADIRRHLVQYIPPGATAPAETSPATSQAGRAPGTEPSMPAATTRGAP
jgi:tetratricopeptide (TPR) repeat protein